ncbi:protein of unknown function [Mycolicibacterium canariasense]|uniref:Peroxynitrite isomerase n=1 Tax=Mycolicibacterium canariasense TaxID=228230 RepID=A0A100WKF8_MYCCR|nr:FABP family protein [Mycolicibacterium canariasense]MCV7207721.1 FABP family protein [Mycolicibacterium canariasense]ORV08926.1 fatty acid-binding-like protein [Mycolicibacterium canariasense]GAS99836.1 protein of unknown function [Mycolicibacterium canariasense]
MPDLHPAVAVLAPLLGTWTGPGAGEYPTIEPFGYLESVTFDHVGKPFLAYSQRTKAADDGRPLHAESGYVRVPAPGRVEFLIAHPTGIVEVLEGSLDVEPLRIDVTATTIGRSASAKEVTALARSFALTGDELTYTVRMGAVGQPLQHHLSATLRRQS